VRALDISELSFKIVMRDKIYIGYNSGEKASSVIFSALIENLLKENHASVGKTFPQLEIYMPPQINLFYSIIHSSI